MTSEHEALLRTITGFLGFEYVLLLLVEPALALFIAASWLFVRFVWPMFTPSR